MTHKPTNPYARKAGLLEPVINKIYPPSFSEIVEDHLWQSGLPNDEMLKEIKPTMVIDCCWFSDDYKALPKDMSRISATANSIAYAIKSGARVLVHCHHGINRSSLVVCLTLLRLHPNWSGAQAIKYLETKRPHVLWNQVYRKYISTLQPLGSFNGLIEGEINP